MNIFLTSTFLSFFRKNAELVNNRTFELRFIKELPNKHTHYRAVLDTLNIIIKCISWIQLNNVRLQHSPDIENKGLQFFAIKNNTSLEDWEKEVLLNFANTELVENEIDDYMNFDFNYQIMVDSLKDEVLYKIDKDCGVVGLGYNTKKNITYFHINIELRKELFEEKPWGDSYPEFILPLDMVNHNKSLLQNFIQYMNDAGFLQHL